MWGRMWAQGARGRTEKGELGDAHRQQSWFLDVALCGEAPASSPHSLIPAGVWDGSSLRYNNNYSFLTATRKRLSYLPRVTQLTKGRPQANLLR